MRLHRITITLEEPATLGAGAVPGNEMRSLGHIPATALRGALFEELRLAGMGEKAAAWFGPDGPRLDRRLAERLRPDASLLSPGGSGITPASTGSGTI